MTYLRFKQQCVSLRTFAFVGVCGYCVLLPWHLAVETGFGV